MLDTYNMAQTKKVVRILVVDDRVLLCEALTTMFASVDGMLVVATATDTNNAMMLARNHKPDVIIIYALLPNRSAFDFARMVKQYYTQFGIMFLDDRVNPSRITEALRIGASGYFTHRTPFELIARGVSQVATGQKAFCPEIKRRLVSTPQGFKVHMQEGDSPLATLTPRETEVLSILAQGLSVKQCAQRLHLAHSTVDNHKSRLMKKLDVHKASELTRLAIREGLIST